MLYVVRSRKIPEKDVDTSKNSPTKKEILKYKKALLEYKKYEKSKKLYSDNTKIYAR